MIRRRSLLLLPLALPLAACGRKGPLELPPREAAPPVESRPPAEPASPVETVPSAGNDAS